jgi:nucleoside-diphosphate-sugar epimerase
LPFTSSIRSIVVTGGYGKANRPVVRRLVEAGYRVLNVDLTPSKEPVSSFLRVDLTELGQAVDALKGSDAVVHLAAIPAPRLHTDEVTFRTNVTSTHNVFAAATTLGLKRVVWASSETVLGLPSERVQPDYAPIDEDSQLYPETLYALSKILGE